MRLFQVRILLTESQPASEHSDDHGDYRTCHHESQGACDRDASGQSMGSQAHGTSSE